MLVRDAGDAWQIVLQTEHGELAGQFARAWSPRPEPFASLEIVARRHDDGWFVWEHGPSLDPDGRPANFLDVPVPLHLAFYKAAIAAVTDEDAYAGLILSMHGAGIYKYRYGFQSDLRMRFVDDVEDDAARFVAEQEDSYPGAPRGARHRRGRGLARLQAAAGVGPALALRLPAGPRGPAADADRARALRRRGDRRSSSRRADRAASPSTRTSSARRPPSSRSSGASSPSASGRARRTSAATSSPRRPRRRR